MGNMSTLAVIIDNEFENEKLLYQALQDCTIDRIITSDLTYADILLRRFAEEHAIPVSAGENEPVTLDQSIDFIRNRSLIDQADVIMVFWDGKNTFIKKSIDYAKEQKKEIQLFYYTLPE